MAKSSKPHPNFPLYLHGSGQWAKRIKGKTYYFGKDAMAALDRWLAEKDGILAGRRPIQGNTVRDLANAFMRAKEAEVYCQDVADGRIEGVPVSSEGPGDASCFLLCRALSTVGCGWLAATVGDDLLRLRSSPYPRAGAVPQQWVESECRWSLASSRGPFSYSSSKVNALGPGDRVRRGRRPFTFTGSHGR
jgi:hypothetical protein